MISVDPIGSILLTVGGRRALTVICPIDLTARGHYDNMSTIPKSSTLSVGISSYWPRVNSNLDMIIAYSFRDTHMLDRVAG